MKPLVRGSDLKSRTLSRAIGIKATLTKPVTQSVPVRGPEAKFSQTTLNPLKEHNDLDIQRTIKKSENEKKKVKVVASRYMQTTCAKKPAPGRVEKAGPTKPSQPIVSSHMEKSQKENRPDPKTMMNQKLPAKPATTFTSTSREPLKPSEVNMSTATQKKVTKPAVEQPRSTIQTRSSTRSAAVKEAKPSSTSATKKSSTSAPTKPGKPERTTQKIEKHVPVNPNATSSSAPIPSEEHHTDVMKPLVGFSFQPIQQQQTSIQSTASSRPVTTTTIRTGLLNFRESTTIPESNPVEQLQQPSSSFSLAPSIFQNLANIASSQNYGALPSFPSFTQPVKLKADNLESGFESARCNLFSPLKPVVPERAQQSTILFQNSDLAFTCNEDANMLSPMNNNTTLLSPIKMSCTKDSTRKSDAILSSSSSSFPVSSSASCSTIASTTTTVNISSSMPTSTDHITSGDSCMLSPLDTGFDAHRHSAILSPAIDYIPAPLNANQDSILSPLQPTISQISAASDKNIHGDFSLANQQQTVTFGVERQEEPLIRQLHFETASCSPVAVKKQNHSSRAQVMERAVQPQELPEAVYEIPSVHEMMERRLQAQRQQERENAMREMIFSPPRKRKCQNNTTAPNLHTEGTSFGQEEVLEDGSVVKIGDDGIKVVMGPKDALPPGFSWDELWN